ncbi:MAG: hypothetical protein ROR55_16135 [Devosia sp.]
MNKVESDINEAMDDLYDVQRILRCVWGAAPLLSSDLECGEAITLTLDMVFERMEAVEGKLEAARESAKAAPQG